jgi:hypothetical protein
MLTTLPLGFTTWAGFLYVGLRARRRSWLLASGAYGAAALAMLLLVAFSPTDAQGEYIDGTWQDGVGITVMMATWFVGIVHAVLINRGWLTSQAPLAGPPGVTPS